jgi:NapC/NirT cytochrome c family, N-terminal region
MALRELTRHPLSMVGAALAVSSGVIIVALTIALALDLGGGPYLGILAFMIMPVFFVGGLVLMPVGAWLQRRREARALAGGDAVPRLPVIDLNDSHTRSRVLIFAGLTVINLLIVSVAGYGGITFMETPTFCGSCHSVMDPEATAHRSSPHARVECVGCHIGPGASWFVKSKLSGAWQVISVTFGLYSRPIPTPVAELRPARGTCEQCHLPGKFVGDRLEVRTRFDDDEAVTPLKTVLNLRVGGRGGTGSSGIHWHVAEGVEVRYLADPTRQQIAEVELKAADGTRRLFKGKTPAPAGAVWRTMDCIDCHNRPSHVFRTAEAEVDAAIESGKIDRSLPFVRREAVKALSGATGTHEAVRSSLPAALRAYYTAQYPKVAAEKDKAIEAAGAALADAYARNIWPNMNIGWGTYKTNLGHKQSPGCWRCHDDEHADQAGKTISQDCQLCHELLADGEKDPAILKVLRP